MLVGDPTVRIDHEGLRQTVHAPVDRDPASTVSPDPVVVCASKAEGAEQTPVPSRARTARTRQAVNPSGLGGQRFARGFVRNPSAFFERD